MSDEKTDTPLPNPEFMTCVEVAKELGVSKMTVYRMVGSGALFSIRVGRAYRIPRTAYDAYRADVYSKGPAYVRPAWADSGE